MRIGVLLGAKDVGQGSGLIPGMGACAGSGGLGELGWASRLGGSWVMVWGVGFIPHLLAWKHMPESAQWG